MSLYNPLEKKPSRLRLSKETKLPFLLSLLLASISTFTTHISYPSLQPELPLLYSLALPEQQLIAKEFIFLLPSVAFGVFFFHLVSCQILYSIDRTFMKLMSWLTVIFEALLLFSLIRIISIT